MNVPDTIIVFVLAYLLGSIPAAVWIGKIFHNIDVRQHGSGNAGTTNVIRVLGWKTGIPVLAMEGGGTVTEQVAELEKNEIILHLQLTKKLEELSKKDTDESI